MLVEQKILIVEDEPVSRQVLQYLLKPLCSLVAKIQ